MSKLKNLAATCALSMGLALPAAAQDASTVVATVNGTEITLGHMIAMRSQLPPEYQQLEDQVLFDGILEQVVQQTALADGETEMSLGGQMTLDNQRRALLAQEALRTLAADAVTPEEVQAAYDENFSGAEPQTEYNASHILVETEEEAATILEELEGGADFAELATERSTGPSGPSGGELGWFAPGAMVPAFDEAVQGMSAGELAGPVQTQFGWHVIKLNDTRQKDAPSFDEVRDQLTAQLQQEAVSELVADAVSNATVERSETEIDPALLRNDNLLAE